MNKNNDEAIISKIMFTKVILCGAINKKTNQILAG